MTLAEFHERVCEPPLAQVRKKGALPLCCCVLTRTATTGAEARTTIYVSHTHAKGTSDLFSQSSLSRCAARGRFSVFLR